MRKAKKLEELMEELSLVPSGDPAEVPYSTYCCIKNSVVARVADSGCLSRTQDPIFSLPDPVPEFIDPVFTKTSPKRSFSVTQNERFGLVFAKTGSIISGTGLIRSWVQIRIKEFKYF
jgi:hypothetical protein